MSKVVKSVVKGVRNVAKAVTPKAIWNVGSKIGKAIEKNKILKTIAIAAAVYFTGGAAMGAISGASAAATAGTSMLSGAISGAGAGISAAWSGVVGAGSALAGGSLSGAGSSLAGGWANAAGAAAGSGITGALSTTASNLGTIGSTMFGGGASTSAASGWAPGPTGLNMLPGEAAAAGGSSPGIIGKALSWGASNPYLAGQALNVGGKVLAGVAQAKQQEDMMDRQQQMKEDELARYNRNLNFRPNWG